MESHEGINLTSGEFDPEFNKGNPLAFIYLDDEELSVGEGLALDESGRIYVVGSPMGRYGIAAFNADGSYVKTFGRGGKLTDSFNKDERSRGYRIAVIDEKLLVLGSCGVVDPVSERSYPALSRYHLTGTLDTSFGQGGYLVINPDFEDGQTRFLIVNEKVEWSFAHEKIYVAGRRTPKEGRSSTVVMCVDMDGRVDESFGKSGHVTVTHPDYSAIVRPQITVTDDWIYLAGYVYQAGSYRVVARLRLNGELDPNYGQGGFLIERSYTSIFYSLIQRRDNHLLGIGKRMTVPIAPMLVGLTSEGEPDNGFNNGAPVFSDTGGSSGWQRGYVQSQAGDGRIVTVGVDSFSNGRALLARYLPNGELDTSFGGRGTGWLYILDSGIQNGDVIVQSNNDILVVATTSDYKIVVARYKG